MFSFEQVKVKDEPVQSDADVDISYSSSKQSYLKLTGVTVLTCGLDVRISLNYLIFAADIRIKG